MQLRVTVEVFGDKELIPTELIPTDATQQPFAEGIIVGDLDLKRGATTQPILTIRMRNILASVEETIYKDSNS